MSHHKVQDSAASGNKVYAVWEESHDGANRIMFAKSTNRGNTFSKPANLTSGIRVDSETPSIGAFENTVYIVWTDNSPGNYDIFFIKIQMVEIPLVSP